MPNLTPMPLNSVGVKIANENFALLLTIKVSQTIRVNQTYLHQSRHVVPALTHPRGDPAKREPGGLQLQVHDLDL
jgi:hypothetical protein